MITKQEKEEFKKEDSDKEIKGIEDLVLVHVTDYKPEGGVIKSPKDANVKFQEEYDGIKYEVQSQRKTIHFVLNGEVTGTSHVGGTWKNKKYAIIIPLSEINKDDFVGGTPVDFYSKESVEIPKGSYILCSEEERESIQEELGGDIHVIGVEEKYIDGYTPLLLQKLGYKNEIPGDWAWDNEKDNKAAENLIEQNWKIIPHSFSEELTDELMNQDIIRTAIVAKLMKDGNKLNDESVYHILNDHHHTLNQENIFSKNEYMEIIIQKLKEVANIDIPSSVMEEILNIKNGTITDKQIKDSMDIDSIIKRAAEREGVEFVKEKKQESVAEAILRRRIVGEIRLSQIQEKMQQNPDMSFGEILKQFDDIAYNYTTKERRSEFIEQQDIELSETDKKIIGSKELNGLYSEINAIKNVPYDKLSERDKKRIDGFKTFYEQEFLHHFENYRLCTLHKIEEDGRATKYISLIRNDFEEFSEAEIEKVASECIGKDETTIFLNFEANIQSDMSLAEYLSKYENYISKLEQLLGEKSVENNQQKDEISVESLGQQTLEEQEDTNAKKDMQHKLDQKMKEYIIEQEKEEEK